MKIFGFPSSPFVRKCLVVAGEKGIDIELAIATPHKPTPEFLEASPFRMMPAIADGNFKLPDSSAIVHYLEAKYPKPAMIPADPEARGRVIWLEEFSDTILSTKTIIVSFNLYVGPKIIGVAGDPAAADTAKKSLGPALDYLESIVPENGWLAGEFGLADISVACSLKTMLYGWDPLQSWTRAWYQRVSARPAWQKVAAQEKAIVDAALAAKDASGG